jgi:hypothetical protein
MLGQNLNHPAFKAWSLSIGPTQALRYAMRGFSRKRHTENAPPFPTAGRGFASQH